MSLNPSHIKTYSTSSTGSSVFTTNGSSTTGLTTTGSTTTGSTTTGSSTTGLTTTGSATTGFGTAVGLPSGSATTVSSVAGLTSSLLQNLELAFADAFADAVEQTRKLNLIGPLLFSADSSSVLTLFSSTFSHFSKFLFSSFCFLISSHFALSRSKKSFKSNFIAFIGTFTKALADADTPFSVLTTFSSTNFSTFSSSHFKSPNSTTAFAEAGTTLSS